MIDADDEEDEVKEDPSSSSLHLSTSFPAPPQRITLPTRSTLSYVPSFYPRSSLHHSLLPEAARPMSPSAHPRSSAPSPPPITPSPRLPAFVSAFFDSTVDVTGVNGTHLAGGRNDDEIDEERIAQQASPSTNEKLIDPPNSAWSVSVGHDSVKRHDVSWARIKDASDDSPPIRLELDRTSDTLLEKRRMRLAKRSTLEWVAAGLTGEGNQQSLEEQEGKKDRELNEEQRRATLFKKAGRMSRVSRRCVLLYV